MSTSIVTSKGRTTIPIDIRKHLKIHPGDRLEFLIDEKGRVIMQPLTHDITQLKTMLPKPKRKVSVEDMDEAMVKRWAKYEKD